MRCLGVVPPGPKATMRADADQLEQLLINLLRNAADAALETGGGVRIGWSASGLEVELWIEDDGPGLPETANLFVPFFTTKEQGTGLGLAISQSIVQNAGGTIDVQTHSGAGTKFTIVLPAAGEALMTPVPAKVAAEA